MIREGAITKLFPELNNCSSAFRLFSLSFLCSVNCPLIKKAPPPAELQFIETSAVMAYFSFLSSETVSFLRPFLLLAASTLRPLAVSIRWRKPCTALRRLRWGWNVRFIIFLICGPGERSRFHNHHRSPHRWFCERTAKVRVGSQNRERSGKKINARLLSVDYQSKYGPIPYEWIR